MQTQRLSGEGSGAKGERTCLGVDFSSAPSSRKPVVLARGCRRAGAVVLFDWQEYTSLASLGEALSSAGHWVGGFDLPFGLPRALVQELGWPLSWRACIQHYSSLSRAEVRQRFKAYCDARPAGRKFAHRACDGPAGASPSMKWVNPPVAYMLHAGVPLLLAAGLDLPGLHPGDPTRVALEAYPGLLAREILGRRSYKSDELARQTDERRQAREHLLRALEAGQTRLGLRLEVQPSQRQALVAEGRGDRLDAVLCLMQAAWACEQPNWGQPADMDPLEGWILSA